MKTYKFNKKNLSPEGKKLFKGVDLIRKQNGNTDIHGEFTAESVWFFKLMLDNNIKQFGNLKLKKI